MAARVRFVVRGQVQGVGFRPFVFSLAKRHGLTGFVRNSPRGVVVEVQGDGEALDGFAEGLATRLPPLARVTGLEREDLPPRSGETDFGIAASSAGDSHAVLISPDICTCDDCLADMASGRRRHYPFTNCTNCGPRYTITRSIPYDRSGTSMACFPLCPDCRAEYENPADRRFHAQPNACPLCGPSVRLEMKDRGGAEAEADGPRRAGDDEALRLLAAFLLDGGIAAVKGLGGFHLACDARDDEAVALLRRRKHRPHKPFAVMTADLAEARRFAEAGEAEAALLRSPERPIVICPLRTGHGLSDKVSPDTAGVGVMLPYTPLHFRLFAWARALLDEAGDPGPAVFVMTSGNPGGEPICLGNREARARLDTMADAFLFHNRDILIRVDDSVTRPLPDGGTLFHRRARGYVPRPIVIDAALSGEGAGVPCVFGAGADLKNTLCLTKGADAFVSQHIGDMDNVETGHFHGEIREHLAGLLRVRPDVLVRDRHPDFLSGRLSDEYAGERGLPVMTLQHHAAHAFALLAEHAFRGRALVLALDGTGLGTDGALWGGELLLADTGAARRGEAGWKRLGHMAPMDLPGGEAAIREPWRIAHALLWRLGLLDGGGDAAFSPPWLPERAATAALLPTMLVRGVNNPSSTSCGRFFDAASALLGLCDVITYEGQAAIRLEEAQGPARPWDVEPERLYPCPVTRPERGGPLLLDSRALFRVLALDKAGGPEQSQNAEMALRFHHSLARGLVDMAVLAAGEHGLDCVGLSGGCLHNLTLSTLLTRGLEAHGLRVLRHEQLSPGDGCISLGQAFWGRLAAGGR